MASAIVVIIILAALVGIVLFIVSLLGGGAKKDVANSSLEIEFKDNLGNSTSFDDSNKDDSWNQDSPNDENSDAFEGWFIEAENPKNVNLNLRLNYQDGKGNKTDRLVRVRQYDNSLYGGLVIGHCHLRDATRTFRFDRIISCIDVDTGESILDVRAYLMSEYAQSKEYTLDMLFEDNEQLLRILFYMVKADGQFRAKEKTVVLNYLRRITGDARLDEKSTTALLNNFNIPTERSFKIAVGKVLRGGGVDPSMLKKCCHDIVQTQKSVHPMEERALEYVDRKTSECATADIILS